ncbi:MAG: hypothetical protein ACTSPB_04810 [Candidatus Thorarchaeota archaeon]
MENKNNNKCVGCIYRGYKDTDEPCCHCKNNSCFLWPQDPPRQQPKDFEKVTLIKRVIKSGPFYWSGKTWVKDISQAAIYNDHNYPNWFDDDSDGSWYRDGMKYYHDIKGLNATIKQINLIVDFVEDGY